MQILPHMKAKSGLLPFDFFPTASTAAPGASLHASLDSGAFAEVLAASAARPAVVSAQDAATPAVSSPAPGATQANPAAVAASQRQAARAATPAPEDGPLREVRMTGEDYAALKDRLEQAGLPKETVEEIGRKIQSPEGLTWAQFMVFSRQAMMERFFKPVELTQTDREGLKSFFTGLGFDAKQAQELTQTLANGKAGQVFGKIAAQLASMEKGQTVSVNREQAQALGKALRLPAGAQAKLEQQFAGLEKMELTPQTMHQVMLGVKNEATGLMHQAREALNGLASAARPVMDKAKARLKAETKDAQDLGSAQTRPSRFLADPQDVQVIGKDGKDAKSADSKGQSVKDLAGAAPQQGQASKESRRQESGLSGKQDGKDAKSQDRSLNEFARKVKVEGEPMLTPDARAGLVQGLNALKEGHARASEAAQNGPGARGQAMQFMDQVESGILKNLGQGMRQLTLELTPDTLGRLNVVLTVKGKEVQALIKAETPEAERMLAENLQQIKQSLENQGLTVSKMEVRTGLQQDSSLGQQQWSGAEKHNQQQERREAQERLRTQALLSGRGEGGGLAQAMQSMGHEARISQGGLDLVA